MGFFDNLWSGLKLAGQTALSVVDGGLDIGSKIMTGFENGGPLGGIIGGITSAIPAISGTVDRIKHYASEARGDQNTQASDVLPALDPMAHVKVMNQAIQNLSADAPQTVKDMAVAGAKFHDGLAQTGSIVAASKMAGATPLTQHLGNGVSSAIQSEVSKRIGFSPLHNYLGSAALKGASMIPTTSAMHGPITDLIKHGGPESVGVRKLAMSVQNPVSNMMVVGGG